MWRRGCRALSKRTAPVDTNGKFQSPPPWPLDSCHLHLLSQVSLRPAQCVGMCVGARTEQLGEAMGSAVTSCTRTLLTVYRFADCWVMSNLWITATESLTVNLLVTASQSVDELPGTHFNPLTPNPRLM